MASERDDECPWCGSPRPADRCPVCDHTRGVPGWPYVVFSPGGAADYPTVGEARSHLAEHPQGALYVRSDMVIHLLLRRARDTMPEREARQFTQMLRRVANFLPRPVKEE